MKNDIQFVHDRIGVGRPQILLIGNGLEKKVKPTIPDPKGRKNQLSWDELIDEITAEGSVEISQIEKDSIPFPLLYSLLSTSYPAPSKLSKDSIEKEEARLKDALGKLSQASFPCLDLLKTINADHIFTTNYNYSLEQAFFPGKDFMNGRVRSENRFNLSLPQQGKMAKKEICYRLHSGYLARNLSGANVGLWHIHGECSVPRGVVLSHDRYGRLLSRIERICDTQNYSDLSDKSALYKSWPELFLYGDVYIVGFGFDLSEFDLWWLLKRKQREQRGDGRVFFYTFPDDESIKLKMLRAHGVETPTINALKSDYQDLYVKSLEDVRMRICMNKR